MNYVIYHKKCQDGTMSAAICELAGIRGEYIPCSYGDKFPIDLDKLGKEDNIYIVDFSFDRETLVPVHKLVGNLVVLDHHKSAKVELEGLSFTTFDMKKCGATITWDHFFPDTPRPAVLKWIQEYDLWEKSSEMADIINLGIGAQPWVDNVSSWVNLLTNFTEMGEHLISAGMAVSTTVKDISNSYIKSKNKVKIIKLTLGGDTPDTEVSTTFNVGIANATEFPNEVAEAIYNHNGWDTPSGYVDFVILYYFNAEGKIKLSFRGNKETCPDLSLIANTLYGGGGHPSSSGVRLNRTQSLKWFEDFIL